MPERRFRALERLIQQANRTSSSKPNSAQMLAEVIRVITQDGSDPYLVLGVLVEGAVHTIAKHIPPARRAETVSELRHLLAERLKAHRLE